jgi:hypothetical protein
MRPDTRHREGRVSTRAGMDGFRKPRPPPGFHPRTVQPVAGQYTDYVQPFTLLYFSDRSFDGQNTSTRTRRMSLPRRRIELLKKCSVQRFVSVIETQWFLCYEMEFYILCKIPPHFKGIISARSELLAPAVRTNRETDTHRSNVSLRIAHRLLSLVVSQFIALATTTAHLDLAVETRKWLLWNSDGRPFQVWTLVMTVLPSESYNGQSLGSSKSTRHISIANTCHDSPNLIGVREYQQSTNRKHII